MRRLLSVLLILCVLSPTAHAGVAILAGAVGFAPYTVTGVTAHISIVAGTAFITDCSISLPFPHYVEIDSDGTGNNYVTAYVGGQSAGGETYGSNPYAGGYNFTSGWSSLGATPTTSDSYTSTGAGGIGQGVLTTAGQLYIAAWNGSTTAASVKLINGDNSIHFVPAGFGTGYGTGDANTTFLLYNNGTGVTTVTSLSLMTVLTPSNGSTSGTFGVWLEATRGGTSHTLSGSGGTFNPNASSFVFKVSQ